jgi:hypothetical protein
VEFLAILEGTAVGVPSETLPRKRPTRAGETEETDEMTVSSLLPPHYALSVLDKNGHDSLHAEG